MGPHRTKDQKNKMKTTSYKCDKGQVWLQFQDLQVDMKKAHRLIPNRVCVQNYGCVHAHVCIGVWVCECARAYRGQRLTLGTFYSLFCNFLRLVSFAEPWTPCFSWSVWPMDSRDLPVTATLPSSLHGHWGSKHSTSRFYSSWSLMTETSPQCCNS